MSPRQCAVSQAQAAEQHWPAGTAPARWVITPKGRTDRQSGRETVAVFQRDLQPPSTAVSQHQAEVGPEESPRRTRQRCGGAEEPAGGRVKDGKEDTCIYTSLQLHLNQFTFVFTPVYICIYNGLNIRFHQFPPAFTPVYS